MNKEKIVWYEVFQRLDDGSTKTLIEFDTIDAAMIFTQGKSYFIDKWECNADGTGIAKRLLDSLNKEIEDYYNRLKNERELTCNEKMKLSIINGFIDWYWHDDDEREEMYGSSYLYVLEDHVDELDGFVGDINTDSLQSS